MFRDRGEEASGCSNERRTLYGLSRGFGTAEERPLRSWYTIGKNRKEAKHFTMKGNFGAAYEDFTKRLIVSGWVQTTPLVPDRP